MLNKIKHILWRGEGHEGVRTPSEQSARFELMYGDLVIGSLWLEEGYWHFAYSEAFKQQDEVKPIVGFPNLTKIYRQETLWPFFSHRIPSLEQPAIKQAIKYDEGFDSHNEVELLKRFGEHVISNPFSLVSE